MDVTQSLPGYGGSSQPTAISGYISTSRPAPTSFGDPIYVVVPEFSTDYPLGPCGWGSIHGSTLPAQGAKALVVLDQNDGPTVVWWDGAQSTNPTPTWTTPTTFRTNYVDYGATDANFHVGYWLAPNGIMWVRGVVSRITSSWTSGDVLFTLPKAPSQAMDVASAATGSNVLGFAFLQVIANGDVKFLGASGLTWGAGLNLLALDNIRFPVAP